MAGFGFTWLCQNVGLLGGPHEVDEVASQVYNTAALHAQSLYKISNLWLQVPLVKPRGCVGGFMAVPEDCLM